MCCRGMPRFSTTSATYRVDVTLDNFVNLWDGKHIAGAFYGGYHEEVGGTFKSESVAGTFGASLSDRQ